MGGVWVVFVWVCCMGGWLLGSMPVCGCCFLVWYGSFILWLCVIWFACGWWVWGCLLYWCWLVMGCSAYCVGGVVGGCVWFVVGDAWWLCVWYVFSCVSGCRG